MNEIRTSFLRALARTTRLDFLNEDSHKKADACWLVIVRGALGFAYALVGGIIFWLLRSPILSAILGTIAILILHHCLTGTPESGAPTQFRRVILPGDAPTADILANLTFPILLMLTILGGHAFWLPAAFAFGTAIGIEYTADDDATENKLFREWKCWIAAAIIVLLVATLTHLGNMDAMRTAFLRNILLFLGIFLLMPCIRRTPLKTKKFHANCFLGTAVALLLTLIANAL